MDLSCDVCGNNFKSVQGLCTHFKAHFFRNNNCTFCNQSHHSQSALTNHIKLMHRSELLGLCIKCGKPITKDKQWNNFEHDKNDTHMNEHCNCINHMHKVADSFICQICGRGYIRRGFYAKHLLKIHKIKPKLDPVLNLPVISKGFNCSVCGSWFPDKFKLIRHKKTNHFKELSEGQVNEVQADEKGILLHGSFACPLCAAEYSAKRKLTQHLKLCSALNSANLEEDITGPDSHSDAHNTFPFLSPLEVFNRNEQDQPTISNIDAETHVIGEYEDPLAQFFANFVP